MPLSSGDKLGPYEILSLLGKGGMGEVYRARDGKLNREVAIKVLPPALANDADFVARFQREAQTLAALNHPNIAAIYGLEGNAIVMELVEGETLQGPLPIEAALPLAKQIAEALEAAHDKAIIHRDLKPGNVKVTPEGVVKVLDFGLAKSVSERPTQAGPDSPTLTMRATEAGLILGTAGYMSPEQAAGKSVDRRADIWAFGVVLHELLTGKRLFEGETVTHTLADVVKGDIDFSALPEGSIRDLVKRCLDRNIKTRLQHIGEARIALENYAPPKKAAPAKTNYAPWAIAAVGVLAAVASWVARPAVAPSAEERFEINAPAGTQFTDVRNVGGSAISPDGSTVVFVATDAKEVQSLYVRRLDSLESRLLAGTEGAGRPFWSPDGKSIGFVAGGKLKRFDLAGGTPKTLADAPAARGGSWGDDSVILFAARAEGIQKVAAAGGAATAITQVDAKAGETSHYYPQHLPGGKHFLYMVRQRRENKASTMLGSFDGAVPELVLESDYQTRYDPESKSLLYVQDDGTLMARRITFDPVRFEGDPVLLVEGVRGAQRNGYADFSVSRDGALFFGRGESTVQAKMIWRDRDGKPLGDAAQLPRLGECTLSPDGKQIAVTAGESQSDVWIIDVARGTSTRLTLDGASSPRWSPDGKFVYYRSKKAIYKKPSDGSGEELAVLNETQAAPQAVSPDGKQLLFGQGGAAIQRLPLTPNARPEPFIEGGGKFVKVGALFSPDGRWVSFMSDESGREEIYVQGFPDRRGKWMISSNGGRNPKWRADGKEIYWISPDNAVMAASVELQAGTVTAGVPHLLFRGVPASNWDVSADGKRFLTEVREGADKPAPPMVIVKNWRARLAK